MSYNVNYSDSSKNPSSIVVEDKTIDNSTSISFPGKNLPQYGQIIAENFLHLLENFANSVPPANPTEGQLWYDSGTAQLKVYDGTLWSNSGGLKKGPSEPTNESNIIGDLWVDTSKQQLYLYSGSRWLLVGPEYSAGASTGLKVQSIVDITNTTQTVVAIEILNEVVAYLSKVTFTPKSTILGFPIINSGVTLNSNYNKYYGVSEKSEALLINGTTVPGSSFLRSDTTNNTSFPINIRNSSGLSIGTDSELKLFVDGSSGVLYHRTSGSHIDIRVNTFGDINTVMRIDSNKKVGINTTNPQEELDVAGNILLSGVIKTTNTTNSTSLSTGSMILEGGAAIAKDVIVGGNLVLNNDISLSKNIIPLLSNTSSIGTNSNKIKEIFATRIYSDLTGNVQGNVSGNAGTATKLVQPTTFLFSGDVAISQLVSIDGSGGSETFNTVISEDFISTKQEVMSINESDEVLLNRVGQGLRKITKSNLWNSIPQFPVGAVIPYAGPTAPVGWLLCDGSEVKTSDYPQLFDVIGYAYGDSLVLEGFGTFKLPDLRARTALGSNTMDNDILVPSKTNTNVLIPTNGGPTDRVDLIEAQEIGLSNGVENISINVNNLPDHDHDLKGQAGNQYYAFRNVSGTPADQDAISGFGSTTSGLGQYLTNSGGILTNDALQQPINIMNPFLTLNYIIYTGKGE